MLWITLALSFATGFMLLYSVFYMREWNRPINRLDRYVSSPGYPYLDYAEKKERRKLKNIDFRKSYRGIVEESEKKKGIIFQYREKLENKLGNAEIPLTVEEYIFAASSSTLAVSFLSYMITKRFEAMLVFVVVIPIIFYLHIRYREKKILDQFEGQIADAMDMMAGTLRAGYSFLQSMETISREMAKPISKEFGKTIKEMKLGVSQEAALNNMVARVDSDDLDLLVTAIIINRQIGGNLAEIMDNISSTIRERYRLKGELKVLTSQARMSGMVVRLLPVGLIAILMVINPSHIITLFTDPLGIMLVIIALVGQIIGYLLIRKFMDIKY